MKKLLLLTIALLLIAGAYADVTIGTGTSTQYYPMSTYYNYYRSATLYTAAEIGATGSITSLQWYCGTANTTTSVPVVIYMKHSDATVLATDTWANYSVDAVQVYSGTETFSATGWYTFNITDFDYNGTQNLMILIQSGSAPYTSPYPVWRYSTTTTNMFARVQADTSLPTSLTASTLRPNITLVGITQTTPPGIASLVFPTPSGVGGVGITPTLSWAAGTGTPTGYDVYFGETLPAEGSPNVDHTVQTATTWAPGTLSYGTAYSWKIVPWNAYGHPAYADCPTWTFTTMADPTEPLDYTQDFNSGTSLSAIKWTGTMNITAAHGKDGTNGLNRNLYSSVTTANAVTPPIGPMTGDCQILFDYRIVNYSGYPATGTTLSATDKIEVQISTDNGATFNTIYTIDQSNHVTSNAFVTVTIPVTAYNGNIIAVKYLCTWGAGDYYVDIDNVIVREAPYTPTFSISPELTEAWPFGDVQIGTTVKKQFTITNTGVGSLNISDISTTDTYYGVEEIEPIDHALATNESTSFFATFTPLVEGGPYAGTITVTWSSGTKETYPISFTGSGVDYTIYAGDLPYPQNFDSVTPPALPGGWTKQVAANTTYAVVQTYASGTPYSTPNHAYLYNSSDAAAELVLISPTIDPDLTTLRARFWAKGGTGYTLQVGTMDGAGSKATFTNLQTIDLTSTYTEYTVDFDGYAGTDQYIAFKHGLGGTYRSIYIDNVVIELLPLTGVLKVTPDPVECGSAFIGFEKTVQVSLTNIGGAPFDISAGGITLSDYTNFNLSGLPTLPVTINPDDPAVTFNVVFAPTAEGPLTTNLLINDTRLASSVVVNGTGAVMPIGEICENPYPATLPLVDYAGTTAGYANDYTSAMFTGLVNTSYVNGKDWVAKFTVPSAGMLDVSLADQPTYSSQWMGVFLVNTIPSLATPAAVLAQATGNTMPLAITDAIVQPGDYYVIVDNWPAPADVYFVLNISFEAVSSAPSPAVVVSPLDDAQNVPLTQTLNWSSGGGYVEGYRLSFGTVDPYAVIVDNVNLNMLTTYDPDLAYGTEYWWTVTPYNYIGDATPVSTWTFTTLADPTVYVPPTYTMAFESWPPLGWDLTGGTHSFVQYTDAVSNHWAKANFWGQTSGSTDIMTTPPIVASQNVQLLFTWSHLYSTTYPNDALAVYMSEDLENWGTPIWSKAGVDLNSADGATSTAPGTGVTETVNIPLAANTTFYIRFAGNSGYGPDLFIDNVIVRLEPTELLAPILDYPEDTATMLPQGGFEFAWHPDTNSIAPESYTLYMSLNPATVLTDVVYTGITGTSFDPTQATPPVSYTYGQTWYWTVGAVAGAEVETATPISFTIQPDPTIHPEDLPWCEGFESYTDFDIAFLPWTNVDVDGSATYGMNGTTWPNTYLPQSFIIYNPSATTPALTALVPHGGAKMAACFSATTPPNDDWLITPPIVGVSGLQASFWAMSYTADYGLERFNVGVSTTGTDPEDFTIISGASYLEAPIDWTQYTYPLEYPGQTIYVGIQCVSYDAFFLLVDDFCLSVPWLEAPVVTIALTGGVPTLVWTAVENAALYEVYGSIDPMAADPWTLLTDPAISEITYQYTGTDAYHFFKVIALNASKRDAAPAKKSRIGLPTATKETNPMLKK